MALIRRPIPDVEEEFRKAEEKRLAELAKKLAEEKRKAEEDARKNEEELRAFQSEQEKRAAEAEEREQAFDDDIKGRGMEPLPRPMNEDKATACISSEDQAVRDVYMNFYRAVGEMCNDSTFIQKLKAAKRVRYEFIEVLDMYDDTDEGPKDDRYTMVQDRCVEMESIRDYLMDHDFFYLVLQKLQTKTKLDMDICEFYEPDEVRVYRRLARKETGGMWDMCLAETPAKCMCSGAWKSKCDVRANYASRITEKLASGKLL